MILMRYQYIFISIVLLKLINSNINSYRLFKNFHCNKINQNGANSLFNINNNVIKQSHTSIFSLSNDISTNQINNNETITISNYQPEKKKMSKNLKKRWATGLSLGAIGTLWIASGNKPFTFGFLCMSLIVQSEYYSMVKAVGVEPATKTGILSSLLCYITASMLPAYHELVMPISATYLMLWLLIFNKKSASISEISTSLLGMFYIGYLPSFWVRLRALNGYVKAFPLPYFLKSWSRINPDAWTQGSIITWWTWTSIVVADVSAYFIGKKYGKHKLSMISSAAGSASPNKTIEGALGGFISCTLFSILGAYLMNWPLYAITGSIYGLLISFIALVGDLTASMMKRDARLKDTGTIFPGHGGFLDRFDSYMFTAPAAYFFCRDVIPFTQKLLTKN